MSLCVLCPAAFRLRDEVPVVESCKWPGPGFPANYPPTDFGRQGHWAESQLPGAASYSHWRP